MNLKFKSIMFFLAMGIVVSFTSCDDDEPEAAALPKITLKELGESDSKKATIGDELHIEADVVAAGRIAKIEVELHSEDDPSMEVEEEFEDGFEGLLNVEFHEHIEIPSTFAAGEYHFHLKVVDQLGQTAEVDADVIVELP